MSIEAVLILAAVFLGYLIGHYPNYQAIQAQAMEVSTLQFVLGAKEVEIEQSTQSIQALLEQLHGKPASA